MIQCKSKINKTQYNFTQEAFFEKIYIRSKKFLLCYFLLNIIFLNIQIFTLALSKLQKELVGTSNFAHWMYYVDVLNPHIYNRNVLKSLCNNAIESVKKEHMTPFNKSLPMCDLVLGLEFPQQVQVHYDMNLNLKMFMETLQMLVSSQVSNKQKVFWPKHWNQSPILKEPHKFLKVDLSNVIFEKWLHKATFWFQVLFPSLLLIPCNIHLHCITFTSILLNIIQVPII